MRPRRGVLLDTHVLLWSLAGSSHIGKRLQSILDSETPVYFSAVSIAEITIKVSRGKLAALPGLPERLRNHGLLELSLDAESAEAFARFSSLTEHDPFDRILVAQAAHHALTLETADDTLLLQELDHVKDARH